KIEVDVRRPGVKVRARNGYYPPSDVPRAPLKPKELDPRVRAGLDSPFLVEGLPLRMAAYVFGPSASGKASVLVVAEADPEALAGAPQGGLEATLDSYLVISARDSSFSLPVEKELSVSVPASARGRVHESWLPLFRDLELPPGPYQARLLLRD